MVSEGPRPELAIHRHQYDAGYISFCLKLASTGSLSQRSTASVLEPISDHCNLRLPKLPVANSIRLWTFRLGLFALLQPKPKAEDWIWLVDHTVQLGPWKCLAILGIRRSEWESLKRPLTRRDLSLMNLTPMRASTKEEVKKQLAITIQEQGSPPMAILSDEGAEIVRGVELLNVERQKMGEPSILHVHDIKHKAAIFLRKELGKTKEFEGFINAMTRTRLKVTLTSLAFLNPPRLRNKARFMDLEHIVAWASKVLKFVEETSKNQKEIELDQRALRAKVGWIRKYADAIARWSELLKITNLAQDYIRRNGYHANACTELKTQMTGISDSENSKMLRENLLEFVDNESKKLNCDAPVLGHTEVIESLFGSYKRTQANHSQGGMTGSLLNIGAMTLDLSPEVVKQALGTVSVKQVCEWTKRTLGRTVGSMRRSLLDIPCKAEQKPCELQANY